MDKREELPENVLLIGSKNFMQYMRSIELLIRSKKKPKTILKARGQNIKKAIDLVEAAKNKFLSDLDLEIGEIKVYTSKFQDKEGIERSVSCLDIELLLNNPHKKEENH